MGLSRWATAWVMEPEPVTARESALETKPVWGLASVQELGLAPGSVRACFPGCPIQSVPG